MAGVQISVVAPAYNEQDCLAEFVRRTDATLASLNVPYEILIVNDGSKDQTLAVAKGLTARYPRLEVLNFSRNFGHEMASSAGLAAAAGKAVVLIDSDLQDPPELIADLYRAWQAGGQVVYAQRRQRDGETWFKRKTSWAFYRVMRWLTRLNLPTDTGDYRLMDRIVVDAFLRMPERHRFVRGMVTWLGFRQEAVPFDRDRRFAGITKYNLRKLLALSIDSMLGFTTRPLRLATFLGLALFCFALTGFGYIFLQKLFETQLRSLGAWPDWLTVRQPGYALLMCTVFLIGGVQSLMLGVLGEYVGRIYEQVQGRPLFLVESRYKGDTLETDAADLRR